MANPLNEMTQAIRQRTHEGVDREIPYELYIHPQFSYMSRIMGGKERIATLVPYDTEEEAQAACDVLPSGFSITHGGQPMLLYAELLCGFDNFIEVFSKCCSINIGLYPKGTPEEKAAKVQAGSAAVEICGRVTELLRIPVMSDRPFTAFKDCLGFNIHFIPKVIKVAVVPQRSQDFEENLMDLKTIVERLNTVAAELNLDETRIDSFAKFLTEHSTWSKPQYVHQIRKMNLLPLYHPTSLGVQDNIRLMMNLGQISHHSSALPLSWNTTFRNYVTRSELSGWEGKMQQVPELRKVFTFRRYVSFEIV